MHFPKPGKPVRGSNSGQPIMALFDLLGRSWSMGIIWNLHNSTKTFREIQNACETLSPTTLNNRLKELKHAYIVERTLDGYQLTETGTQLFNLLEPLGYWAKSWAQNYKELNE